MQGTYQQALESTGNAFSSLNPGVGVDIPLTLDPELQGRHCASYPYSCVYKSNITITDMKPCFVHESRVHVRKLAVASRGPRPRRIHSSSDRLQLIAAEGRPQVIIMYVVCVACTASSPSSRTPLESRIRDPSLTGRANPSFPACLPAVPAAYQNSPIARSPGPIYKKKKKI